MATFLDVHPENPQQRLIDRAAQIMEDGGVIAYPTDSCYALGCAIGNRDGMERIRQIRHLTDAHEFTLICHDFSQLNTYVQFDNSMFRSLKAATPGPYTFIMHASRETPRAMQDRKKRTVGVRIPDHVVALALVEALGTPIVSSTLMLPGRDDPPLLGWEIKDELDNALDAVIDGETGFTPTTVIDCTSGAPEIVRVGAGDPSIFE